MALCVSAVVANLSGGDGRRLELCATRTIIQLYDCACNAFFRTSWEVCCLIIGTEVQDTSVPRLVD